MSYVSFNSTLSVRYKDTFLNRKLLDPSFKKAIEIWGNKHDKHSSPVEHVGSRVLMVGTTCLAPLTSAGDAAIGIAFGVGNLLTAGCSSRLNDKTFKYLGATNLLLSLPFHILVSVINSRINPKSECPKKFILGRVAGKIAKTAHNLANSDNKGIRGFAERQIASRLTYALLAVGCVVSRVAEFAIGLVAAPLAILGAPVTLLFKDKDNSKFNEYHGKISGVAYKGLQVTGIVKDIFFCATKIINPHAGQQSYKSDSSDAFET